MLEQPKAFDHFTIVRILGRGGMGVVYLAKDERLGRPVALKVLDVYDMPDPERRARFLREARAAAAIRHPNVATIYEVDEDSEGIPYLAMEYCEGLTLAQLVRRGPVQSRQFLDIARQIADGVAAAHRNGIVHRDIKSANIVLEHDDTVKILDFGLAKRFDVGETQSPTARLTKTGGSFFGTLPYISPEQAQGKPADARSDLFSVGVVLYEIATGALPFDHDSPLMVLEKIRDAEPAPFVPSDPNFPAEAANIISRLLQKSPEDRYQSADDLANDLQTILSSSEEVHAPAKTSRTSRNTAFARTIRRPQRRVRALIVGVVAVVALIAAAALFLFLKRDVPITPQVTAAPIRSLAVLPFRNLSQNTSDSFLSLGLADALVTRLQQLPNVQVRPTSAILRFENENVDTDEAAKSLQVDGVLEGRFVSSGDLVRVNLQLTDTRTGYGIWAGSVDGRRDNLIVLMDKVSSSAATALNEKLGAAAPQPVVKRESRPRHPKAYEHYLRARALTGNFNPENSDAQVANLKSAIDLDSSFAAAYADMAIALSLRNARGFAKPDAELRDAEWYARQAVRLEPNLPEAHMALSRTLVRDPDRFRESVRETLAALRLDPNEQQGLYSLVTYFVSTGELDKTICVGEAFTRQDPTSNEARARGYWNVNSVDPEGSLEMARLALADNDTVLAGHDISALAHLTRGNLAIAEEHRHKAEALVPGHYIGSSLEAMIAAARGDRAASEAAMKRFAAQAETNHWAALRVALSYAKLGDHERAVEWVERAARLGNHNWYFMVKHPWLEPLQQDPKFQAVVSKLKEDLDDVRDDVVGVYNLICPSAQPRV
jgi:serine/threonine protein kinase